MGDDGLQLGIGIIEILGGHEVVVVHVINGLLGLGGSKDAYGSYDAGDEKHDGGQQENLYPDV